MAVHHSGVAQLGLRLAFGVVVGLDATMKWLPGFRHGYVSLLRMTAKGQPGFLHGWFHFWISLSAAAPDVMVDLIALSETALTVMLLLGVARRAGYAFGAVFMLLVWAVGEGFGGPYVSGSTDVGTGIMYTILFVAMLIFAPAARDERLSLDRFLVPRIGWWRHVAEPHAIDRRPVG